MENNKADIDNLICVLINSIQQQENSIVCTTNSYELGVLDGSHDAMIDVLNFLKVEHDFKFHVIGKDI